MPYVTKDRRDHFKEALGMIEKNIENGCTPGDLNFVITKICLFYLGSRGKNYTHINDIVGVLECAKNEFYRKIASIYEDGKEKENGDVYD